MRTTSRRWRAGIAGLTLVLLAAGCGARWSDDQRLEVAARYEGGGVGGGGSTTSAGGPGARGDAETAGGATGTTVAPTDAGGAQAGGTTSGEAPAGEGPGDTGGGGGGSLPCAAPSEAPGVTDDAITVATINSVSGPVPGLGATSEAAARALVARRNAEGGVCGRRIELLTIDDGTDNARFRAAVNDISPRILGIAGLFANGDSGGAQLVEEMQLPVVGAGSTPEFRRVTSMFDVNPPPADLNQVIPKYEHLKEQGVRSAAVITLSNAAAVAELDIHQAQMEAAGITIASRQVLPVTTLSFDGAARVVANSGAQYLFFLAAESHNASMARSMRDSGYQLLFEEYLTGYSQLYLDLAGPAAEGTSSWIRALPTEDGGQNPEQAAFLAWMGRVAPGAPADVYAAQTWAGAKAFFDALEALPGPISREALLAQLRATTSYDADGFFGRINLGEKKSNGCLIGMRVEGGQFRRIVPAEGFLC